MTNSLKQETQSEKIERIKRELNSVPTQAGVYLWKDKNGEIIYIGKAKQLRARMRQYINYQDNRAKIPALVERIHSFEYIVVDNEHESLVLEKNLINQYSPFYNADFKDDKSYPFIAITEEDVFPAIKYTREKHKKGTRYFGPFTDSRAARELIDIARRVVPLCSNTCNTWRAQKRKLDSGVKVENAIDPDSPCFDAHVGLGPGACCGWISPEEYALNVRQIEKFLAGNQNEFISSLENDMLSAAEALNFEQAARFKSRIDTIKSIENKQHAVSTRDLDADIIGFYREETLAGVQVFTIREGRIIISNEFILNKGSDVPTQDLVNNFLLRYYDASTSIPKEVILRELPEDPDAINSWLTEKLCSPHGAKVHLVEPLRGEKYELLELAERNARHILNRYKVRTNYSDKRLNEALIQLESALALPAPPKRIECFDISTNHGSYTVASMVVFTNGQANKNDYRRFKIRAELDEANDFLSMQEVLKRRYSFERLNDKRFGDKPDLIILDGGKPQLNAALAVFKELGINDIPIVGLAKRDEEVFVTWQESDPVILPSGSASLYLIKQIRDEAHRFAITFHRQLRGKAMTASILDDVVGIGPVRKKSLLKYFKSMKRLRSATLDDIKNSGIVPDEVANELFLVIHQYNEQSKSISKAGDNSEH